MPRKRQYELNTHIGNVSDLEELLGGKIIILWMLLADILAILLP
jgi:hypothetical protein